MLENLPISLLDIGVLVALLLGGLTGLVLGFIRAGLFVVSWLGAGLATLFGLQIVTSIFLLSGAYLLMENILPEDKRQKLVKEAKSLPMISVTARVLSESLTNNFNYFNNHSLNQNEIQSKQAINKRIFDRLVLPEAKDAENEKRPGYDKKERSNLERAIDLFNNSSQ